MKKYVWIGMCHQCSAPLWLLGLWETHFLARTRCRQPVCSPAQCPSKQERKELLIILVTTGGRHTQGFLWERSASYQHWVCPRGTHATGQVGPSTVLKGPLVLTGFTMFTVRWASNITPKHISTTSDYCGLFPEYEIQTNKGRMLEGRGGHSSLSCFFFLLVTNITGLCNNTYTQYFSIQAGAWGLSFSFPEGPLWSSPGTHLKLCRKFIKLYTSFPVPSASPHFFTLLYSSSSTVYITKDNDKRHKDSLP